MDAAPLLKPNWRPLAERAHVVVINEAPEAIGRRPPADEPERRAALAEVAEAAPETPRVVARLESPWSDWAGPLLEDLVAKPEDVSDTASSSKREA